MRLVIWLDWLWFDYDIIVMECATPSCWCRVDVMSTFGNGVHVHPLQKSYIFNLSGLSLCSVGMTIGFVRGVMPKIDIKSRGKWLHPTDTVGCNYLCLPFIPASGTTFLSIYTRPEDTLIFSTPWHIVRYSINYPDINHIRMQNHYKSR